MKDGLKDMAYSKAEQKSMNSIAPSRGSKGPSYPWGLCLRLEKPELEKLGFKELPEVGEEVHIMAVGRVTAASQDLREGGEDSRTATIQIVMMQCVCEDEGEGMDDDDTPAQEGKETRQMQKSGSLMSFYREKKRG